MKIICKFVFFGLAALFFASCAGYDSAVVGDKPKAARMYAWYPPSEEELQKRRDRQEELDRIADDIERLFLSAEAFDPPISNLEDSLAETNRNIDAIRAASDAGVRQNQNKINAMETRIGEYKAATRQMGTDIDREQEDRKQARIAKEEGGRSYAAGIMAFRDGKFERSIVHFKNALKFQSPEIPLDQIHFGMGSAYYKIKSYPRAIKHLEVVRKKYPRSPKWLVTHLLLAWIHNDNGEKSRALYLLDNALKRKPPHKVRALIERLYNIIQEADADVSS